MSTSIITFRLVDCVSSLAGLFPRVCRFRLSMEKPNLICVHKLLSLHHKDSLVVMGQQRTVTPLVQPPQFALAYMYIDITEQMA